MTESQSSSDSTHSPNNFFEFDIINSFVDYESNYRTFHSLLDTDVTIEPSKALWENLCRDHARLAKMAAKKITAENDRKLLVAHLLYNQVYNINKLGEKRLERKWETEGILK